MPKLTATRLRLPLLPRPLLDSVAACPPAVFNPAPATGCKDWWRGKGKGQQTLLFEPLCCRVPCFTLLLRVPNAENVDFISLYCHVPCLAVLLRVLSLRQPRPWP